LAHVSTANSINAIRAAKNEILDDMADLQATNADNSYFDFFEKAKAPSGEQGKSNFVVTCEVTPHHLALCGTESPFIRYLVNPPLR
jgi:dihydroorotase